MPIVIQMSEVGLAVVQAPSQLHSPITQASVERLGRKQESIKTNRGVRVPAKFNVQFLFIVVLESVAKVCLPVQSGVF